MWALHGCSAGCDYCYTGWSYRLSVFLKFCLVDRSIILILADYDGQTH